MFTVPLRRILGSRGKRLLGLAVLFGIAFALAYRNSWFNLQQSRPNSSLWLPHSNYMPEKEYEDLWNARNSRPLAWPNHKTPEWRATSEQHQELDEVIRNALRTSGNKGDAREWKERRSKVVQAAKHAWDAYKRDAYGSDEYHPMSHTGSNMTVNGFGYHIADSLDTLLLMKLTDEYKEARDFLVNKISFDQEGAVSLFETTIRVLGGLLSAYHWSGETDAELLRMADDLGSRLAKSFNTETGIPPETAWLRQRGAPNVGLSSTAEVATLQLEFRYLSKLTGKKEYRQQVDKIMQVIFEAHKFDGLVPIYINSATGSFTGDDIRLGSRGDSYYEYLLKQWLQTRQSEPMLRQEYDAAMEGVKKYLVTVTPHQNLTYVGELVSVGSGQPTFNPKMDHLVCFLGGNLALGATRGHMLAHTPPTSLTVRDREDLILAREMAETCAHMYFDTKSGLAPEIAYFQWRDPSTGKLAEYQKSDQLIQPDGDILVHSNDRHNLLRPETVETLFLLWRITGEEKWREYGWSIFEAFEKWAKYPDGAYTSLHDVTTIPPPREDKMETFFMSETLKYFYLLFSDTSTVPLTRYVFNTEAHPLPVFDWE
ncbi:mannosyl-oligosaccharide alpha-1,2-mannosidase [Dipsacomyces acuminosporus]|nr:mannosyl-oligosaccharide alpha-1,2-mannosidase [Dipsacomyces acuminosporus]